MPLEPRETLPINVTHDQASNVMLARNPNLSYLASVTGLSGDSLALLTKSRALHFRDTGEPESSYAQKYYDAARVSTLYAAERFPGAVENTEKFRVFMEEFSKMGSYADDKGKSVAGAEFRPREVSREAVILNDLINGFNSILKSNNAKPIIIPSDAKPIENAEFGVFYKAFNDKSTVTLEEILEKMRDYAQQAILMHNAGYQSGALSSAIRFYRTAEIAWLWDRGNNSRATNSFNALLSCIKDEGIDSMSMPHGVMDLAAFCMDENQFDTYVRYCRKIQLDIDKK